MHVAYVYGYQTMKWLIVIFTVPGFVILGWQQIFKIFTQLKCDRS